MIVLDAGVLIAHLSSADPFHERATDLLEQHASTVFAMSTMTIAECLVRPVALGVMDRALTAIEELGIRSIGITAEDAPHIASIRAASGLRMPDAIVVFTARSHDAAIATTDAALARAASAHGIVTHHLRAR